MTNAALRAKPCRDCGEPVLYALEEDGRPVALDVQAQVYRVISRGLGDVLVNKAEVAFVLHSAICKQVGRFTTAQAAGARTAASAAADAMEAREQEVA